MFTSHRTTRPAIISEKEDKSEAIPYTPAYYEVVTDKDYPVPVAWNGSRLIYKPSNK